MRNQRAFTLVRAWPLVALTLILPLPAASACSWSAWPVEGQWGLWDTSTGNVTIVPSPMFHHGTACEPYPPGHAIDGDMFVWAEPIWGDTNSSRVHVHRNGMETAAWAVPHRGPWRDIDLLGVADGIAYLVWDAPSNGTSGPIGRLDLTQGTYTEVAHPWGDAPTYWMHLTGSVLWYVWFDFGDDEGGDVVVAHDLATGTRVGRWNATGLGLPHDASPVLGAQGNGRLVFTENHREPQARNVWGVDIATGKTKAFEVPGYADEASAAGRYLFLQIGSGFYRVDLEAAAPVLETIQPPAGTGRYLGSAEGTVVTMAWFDVPEAAEEDDATSSNRTVPASALGLFLIVVIGLVLRKRR